MTTMEWHGAREAGGELSARRPLAPTQLRTPVSPVPAPPSAPADTGVLPPPPSSGVPEELLGTLTWQNPAPKTPSR